MKTINTEEIKQKAAPILREEGATRAALFGSVARGESKESSDIDILVDLPRGKTLFDLAGIKIRLEESLGREVDVITYNSIDPLIKDFILKDQLQII